MMDVTSNPLVALYFACKKTSSIISKDGEVVVFSRRALPALNPFVNIIADTYRLLGNANVDLENYYYRAMQQEYCVSLQYPDWVHEHRENIVSFRSQVSQPHLVESFETSIRQKNQQGKFIIFPNKIEKYSRDHYVVIDSLKVIEKDDRMIIKRIIIPEVKKEMILNDLEKVGISNARLFADDPGAVFADVKKKQEERFRLRL